QPIYHLARLSGMTRDQLRVFFDNTSERAQTRDLLKQRVGGQRVAAYGSTTLSTPAAVETGRLLNAILTGDIDVLRAAPRGRLYAAATHIPSGPVPSPIIEVLLEIVETDFVNLRSTEKS